jgi:hypothetical protein
MRIKRALTALCLAIALFGGSAMTTSEPASAGPSDYEWCVAFRPLGTGIVYAHRRDSPTQLLCRVAYAVDSCYLYIVRFSSGGPTGPHSPTGVTC